LDERPISKSPRVRHHKNTKQPRQRRQEGQTAVSLDLEMLKEVLEWLPSDLRYRILEQASHKLAKHPAAKYTAFPDDSQIVNPETDSNHRESRSLRKSHSLVLIES